MGKKIENDLPPCDGTWPGSVWCGLSGKPAGYEGYWCNAAGKYRWECPAVRGAEVIEEETVEEDPVLFWAALLLGLVSASIVIGLSWWLSS